MYLVSRRHTCAHYRVQSCRSLYTTCFTLHLTCSLTHSGRLSIYLLNVLYRVINEKIQTLRWLVGYQTLFNGKRIKCLIRFSRELFCFNFGSLGREDNQTDYSDVIFFSRTEINRIRFVRQTEHKKGLSFDSLLVNGFSEETR